LEAKDSHDERLHGMYEQMDNIDGFTAETRAARLLHGLGFEADVIQKPVNEFSGGWRMRLNLAQALMCRSDILLLDEPTNHLDLEMRLALSVALVEYSGALVVISHDRHLLRSVCDELLVVHSGTVERFNQTLDDYPAWLKEQQIQADAAVPFRSTTKNMERQPSKKQARQLEAQRRQRLKPLLDRVRDIEQRLATSRMELEILEKQLADEKLYTDPGRKEEMTGLIKQQGPMKALLETLEWEWLEASEALEKM